MDAVKASIDLLYAFMVECFGNNPITLAFITAVGPPDWATRQLPVSSDMI